MFRREITQLIVRNLSKPLYVVSLTLKSAGNCYRSSKDGRILSILGYDFTTVHNTFKEE